MISFDLDLETGERVCVRFSDANDGDFAVRGLAPGDSAGELAANREALSGYPWTWLRQVHGTTVREVLAPGDHAGSEGDALVTATAGATLAVQTADCVPVIFVGSNGVVGAAHAGWKGAASGVVVDTVNEMRRLDCGDLRAFIGPAIGPECYEFGADDLDVVAAALGEVVRGQTSLGTPALDLVAGVAGQLAALDVVVDDVGQCTACSGSWFSHRGRVDTGRQTSAVWIEPEQP